MKCFLLFMISVVGGQRRSYIQEIVDRIKNSPRHKSASPSFNGERKFDVIGSGDLPLQSDVGLSESGSQLRPITINKAPSINDVITGSLARFETSSDDTTSSDTDAPEKDTSLPFLNNPFMLTQLTTTDTVTEQSKDEDQLPSQGSHSKTRPSGPRNIHDKPRRRKPNNAFRVRPNIGDLVSQFLTKDKRPPRRRQNHQKKRPPTNQDYYNGGSELDQVEEEEFLPFDDNQHDRRKNQPHGEQLYNNPNRKQGSSPRKVNKPFKNMPVRRPSKNQNRNKDSKFMPPNKTYNGFAPYFKGSLSYDEGHKQHVKKNENGEFPSKTTDHNKFSKETSPGRRRPFGGNRPKKFEADQPRRQRPHPSVSAKRPSNGWQQKDDSNRFAPDKPRRPSPFSDELLPGNSQKKISNDQPRRQRPSNKDQSYILPFSEEISSFGPEQDKPIKFRPDRPKRQRPLPISEDTDKNVFGFELPGNSYKEPNVQEEPNDNIGFFNDVQDNFPDIEAFGIGWDPQKVRRKRAALDTPFYYKPEPRRPMRGQRPRQSTQQANRRQGPGGFWDDADFDAEFFNGGSPQAFNSFDAFSQKDQNPFKTNFSPPIERPRTVRRPNARPKISPKKYTPNRFSTSSVNSFQSIEDNSILGSGNFEILTGGTFYDEDDYRRPYSNNQAAQPYKYFGKNDIFHNFRDFADIKSDNKQKQQFQQGFYYN